tara:strand:+ start:83 stop:538 length:456 start_codon:yes stop_codon:yes gene_type:complete
MDLEYDSTIINLVFALDLCKNKYSKEQLKPKVASTSDDGVIIIAGYSLIENEITVYDEFGSSTSSEIETELAIAGFEGCNASPQELFRRDFIEISRIYQGVDMDIAMSILKGERFQHLEEVGHSGETKMTYLDTILVQEKFLPKTNTLFRF